MPCPYLHYPACDAGRKPVSGARGCRFTQGKGWQCGRVRPCSCFTWPLGGWGDGGTLAGKRPPHKARSDHTKTRHRPARPCSKKRRGDALPAPFCCPSPEVMDVDLVAVFTRRARDITASYATRRAGGFNARRLRLHKTPLC